MEERQMEMPECIPWFTRWWRRKTAAKGHSWAGSERTMSSQRSFETSAQQMGPVQAAAVLARNSKNKW
eukprot:scaffold286158_cov47-Prasinocladus_malaysianus.AAC.1